MDRQGEWAVMVKELKSTEYQRDLIGSCPLCSCARTVPGPEWCSVNSGINGWIIYSVPHSLSIPSNIF